MLLHVCFLAKTVPSLWTRTAIYPCVPTNQPIVGALENIKKGAGGDASGGKRLGLCMRDMASEMLLGIPMDLQVAPPCL